MRTAGQSATIPLPLITQRLEVDASIIDQAALSAVHSHSQGNPRLVDNLMTDALVPGAQMDKKTIDTEVILAAVSNQNLS